MQAYHQHQMYRDQITFAHQTKQASSSSLAKLPKNFRQIHYTSVNLTSIPSANVRWASPEAVNFMDHLYFITNLVLDYLLENDLPQELMNKTLLDDPLPVLTEHKNELIAHFHKLLIAACTCLCIGISIPLFGFMIACCWCTKGGKHSSSKTSRLTSSNHRNSSGCHSSRSRSHRNNHQSDADWLALSARDSNGGGAGSGGGGRGHGGAGYRSHSQYNNDRRHHRHGRGQRRAAGIGISSSSSSHHHAAPHYRSRSVPPSLKYESTCHPCLRTFFSSNLFFILLLISFFAVCAFVTNEYANNGIKQLPKAFNQSLDELQVYLNNTDRQVDNLLRANYIEFENGFNSRLDNAGMIIKQKIAILSEASALDNLTDIVTEFNDTRIRLEKLDRELILLRTRLNTAKEALGDLRRKIENCPPEQCTLLRRRYQNLDNFRILPQYERLPDVKNLIKKVTQLIDSGIVMQVQKGKEEFDKYGTYIQGGVNELIPDVKRDLVVFGKQLSGFANDFSRSMRSTSDRLKASKSSAQVLDQYIEYEQYRRYACLAFASVILFILLCYTLGWLNGSCRQQPTARTYKTRVKTSASASFPFSCGIVTVFLLFLPMILAAIVLFMTGSIGDKIVCRVIKHPEQKQSKQISAMLQNKFLNTSLPLDSTEKEHRLVKMVKEKEIKIYKPNIADIITRCHQKQSMFKILSLEKGYDNLYISPNLQIDLSSMYTVSSLKTTINVDTKMRESIKHLNLDTSRVLLLSQQAEDILKNSMGISFDEIEMSFARLYDNGVAISPIDTEQLIRDIHAQRTALGGVDSAVESSLNIISLYATSFNDQLLPNITNSLLNLKDGVRHLKLKMFHGRNSFGTVMSELIAKLRSAEKQLRIDGRSLIKISATEFVDELNSLIDNYISLGKNEIENVIGQCEPVSRALNITTSTLCDDIILPINGYWLSVVASLILILPATFLAYALKGLYRLVRRSSHTHHSYSYADQDDEISFEEDGEEIALAYHLNHHNVHHLPNKPSSSSALPSAPVPTTDDGWSPTAANYVQNSRPPPYAV